MVNATSKKSEKKTRTRITMVTGKLKKAILKPTRKVSKGLMKKMRSLGRTKPKDAISRKEKRTPKILGTIKQHLSPRNAPPSKSLSKEELEARIHSQRYKWFSVWEQVRGFSYKRSGKTIEVPSHRKKTYVSIPGPDVEVKTKRIKGKNRLVEVFQYKGKKYSRILSDERKEQVIKQPEDIIRNERISKDIKTMIREIPDNIVKGVKKIGKDPSEYSFMLDFERPYDQPERVAVVKGGPSETLKYPDFELFGHTHGSQYFPYPSKIDLINMEYLKPEMIVAGISGKTIVMNIEDKNKYQEWKLDAMGTKSQLPIEKWKGENITWISKKRPPVYGEYPYLRDKKGRDEFLEKTGVKVNAYRKKMFVELKDDPHLEKRMPRPDIYHMQKWNETKNAPPAKETWQDWTKYEPSVLKAHLNDLDATQIKSGAGKLISSKEKNAKKADLIDNVIKEINKLKTHYGMGPG